MGRLVMGRWVISRYFDGSHLSPEFLNTGQTDDIFHDDGKHFSFRQRLKSFNNIGASSGAVFFRTVMGISSGPVALEVESLLMKFRTFLTVTLTLERIELVRSIISDTEETRSSRFPFEANIVPKCGLVTGR